MNKDGYKGVGRAASRTAVNEEVSACRPSPACGAQRGGHNEVPGARGAQVAVIKPSWSPLPISFVYGALSVHTKIP